MELTPNIGAQITEAEREEWTNNYQNSNKKFDIEWSFMGLDNFQKMIDSGSDAITGFKIQPAINSAGETKVIISSCKIDGTILSSYDWGRDCPPDCENGI